MASEVWAGPARVTMPWSSLHGRSWILTLLPALVALAIFALAVRDGGQNPDSLAWVQTTTLLALCIVTWAGMARRIAGVRSLLGVVAVIAFTTVFSVRPESGVGQLLLWLSYLGIFAITASTLSGPSAARRFVDAAVAIGACLCLYALFLFWGAGDPAMRWYSSFGWPNPFAGFLILLLPIAFVRFLHAREGRESFANGAVSLLLGVAWVLTYSRSAWFSGALIVPLGLIVLRPRSWRTAVKRTAILGVLVTVCVLLLAGGTILRGTTRKGIVGTGPASVLVEPSIQGRLNFWASGLRIFRDHPLIGTGAGTLSTAHTASQRDVSFFARDVPSLYIQTAAETGIVGLVALGLMLLSIARLWSRTLRVTLTTLEYPLVVGIGLGLAAFAIHSALDMDWSFPANPAMAFALAGVLAAYDRSIHPPVIRWRGPSTLDTRSALLAILILGAVVAVQMLAAAERHFLDAEAFGQTGRWDAAANRYAQATHLNPLSAKYWAGYGIAMTHLAPPRLVIAISALRRAMRLDRMNAIHPLKLARLIMAQGNDRQRGAEVERLLSVALKLDPYTRPDAYRTLAALYLQQGRTDLADHVYQGAITVYRGHDLGRGSIIYAQLWPNVINLYLDAADLSFRLGDRTRAVTILRELLVEDPYAVPGALRLSRIYSEMGKSNNARTVLETMAARLPEDQDLKAALQAIR